MLDALQLLRDVGASLRPLLLKSFCLLLQDSQPHRDVKPIQQMLAERMKVLLHASDVFAAVGHEYHLLIFLHSLRFHQLPQPPGHCCMDRAKAELPSSQQIYAAIFRRRTESGRPASSMRLRIATPTAASACWPEKLRARRRGPMMALYRPIAVSTRARWP